MNTKYRFLTLFAVLTLSLSACSPAALSTVGAAPANTSAAAAPAAPLTNVAAPTTNNAPAPVTATGPVAAAGSVSDLEATLEQIYSQVNPSVVAIDVIEGAFDGFELWTAARASIRAVRRPRLRLCVG